MCEPASVDAEKPATTETAKRRNRAARATRIPEDFTVTEDMATWARREVPGLIRTGRGKLETDRFIDHFRSASGAVARKTDWVAAWRNWMRRADDDLAKPQRGGSGANGSRASAADRAVAEMQALKAELIPDYTQEAL